MNTEEIKIEPMIRQNVCLNCNPDGLQAEVRRMVRYVEDENKKALTSKGLSASPKNVLVIGGSMGYGLASRIVSLFAYNAFTVSVSYEKPETEKKQGTPGYYNNRAVDAIALENGKKSLTIEGDAFSDEAKLCVIDAIKSEGAKIDLVIYSIASGVRKDPETGVEYRSAIKPIGSEYSGTSLDFMTGALGNVSIGAANEEEITSTIKVMGGEDWLRWMKMLYAAGVLETGVKTVAYSYVGPDRSRAIYRDGTIGRAKDHLEESARGINSSLKEIACDARVSVNKALVTRASAVIPGIALYIAALFSVMKKANTHEVCIEQAYRIFSERLYTGKELLTDKEGRIRVDELEMRPEIQAEVEKRLAAAEKNPEKTKDLLDLEGVKRDFLLASGFSL